MKRVIIAPAELGGAALNELKQWLAISSSDEDEVLLSTLSAAIEMCEAFTGTMPLSATCEEIWPVLVDWQTLATCPVQAITGADGIPAEGSRFALPVDAYEIDLGANGEGLFRILRQGAAGRVAIRFVAGLAPGWGSLPDGLRHGIIRYAAYLFRERDNGTEQEPPASVTALWRPWRQSRLI